MYIWFSLMFISEHKCYLETVHSSLIPFSFPRLLVSGSHSGVIHHYFFQDISCSLRKTFPFLQMMKLSDFINFSPIYIIHSILFILIYPILEFASLNNKFSPQICKDIHIENSQNRKSGLPPPSRIINTFKYQLMKHLTSMPLPLNILFYHGNFDDPCEIIYTMYVWVHVILCVCLLNKMNNEYTPWPQN